MKKRLDIKDNKILSVLDMNARASNTRIGRLIGLSRKSVEYRIKRMEDDGIIKGYFPKLDYLKLGFRVFRTFIRLVNLDSVIEGRIIDYCRNHTSFYWFHPYRGRYDFGFGVLTRTADEFLQFYEDFFERFGSIISARYVTEAAEIHFFQHSYLHGGQYALVSKPGIENECLDRIDSGIISELLKYARTNIAVIAEKIGLSGTAVAARLAKLERSGSLLCFRTQIDFFRLGYSYYKVFMTLKNPKKDKDLLISYMGDEPNVIYATIPIGSYDIECEIVVETPLEFHKIMAEMRKKFDILNYDFLTAEKIIKVRPNNVFDSPIQPA
ncbi:MAG: AsnC family transcriptional regulator [Nanoarchaeota archaeon]|nr:AsnC family transcriptional regulator [Nanoarchaeota archaeon]